MNRSLVPLYKKVHRTSLSFPGFTMEPYVKEIGRIIARTGAKTILDYGCGKGKQYSEMRWHKLWPPVKITLFDPAVKAFSQEPSGQFDGLICCDVLEHIPYPELKPTIEQFAQLTRMWCFITICCRPSDNVLPDGQNEHITVNPERWWINFLSPKLSVDLYLRFTP